MECYRAYKYAFSYVIKGLKSATDYRYVPSTWLVTSRIMNAVSC